MVFYRALFEVAAIWLLHWSFESKGDPQNVNYFLGKDVLAIYIYNNLGAVMSRE